MNRKGRIIPLVLGTVLILGLPPLLVLTTATIEMLCLLATLEAVDAAEVLEAVGLYPRPVTSLRMGAQVSIDCGNHQFALDLFKSAKSKLGSGLDFTLGEGNLLF